MNVFHNRLVSESASRCPHILGLCWKWGGNKFLSSHFSLVTESDGSQAPLFPLLHKVSLFIATFWDLPCQNLCTHSFKKLPMGYISDRGWIVADPRKLCVCSQTVSGVKQTAAEAAAVSYDATQKHAVFCLLRQTNAQTGLATVMIITLQHNLLHFVCCSFHVTLFWCLFHTHFSLQISLTSYCI